MCVHVCVLCVCVYMYIYIYIYIYLQSKYNKQAEEKCKMVNLNRGVRAEGGDCRGAHSGVSILIIINFIREYH